MKTFITVLSITALTVAALAVCAADLTLADSITAVVNEAPITSQQVDRMVGPEEEYAYRKYANEPAKFNREVISLKQNGTEFLIDKEVVLNDFKENLKVPDSIIEEFVSDRLKEYVKEHFNDDNVAFTKQLKSEGKTLDQVRKDFRDTFIFEQMRIKNVPEPIISPLKIENYYVEHHDDFKLEDQVKMRLIFLQKGDDPAAVHKRAGEILSQINGGASFEEMATAYSDGSSRAEGGETGWEDLSVVNKTLVAEVNKLKPGQHSEVIEASEGYYLLLLEDRHPAHVKPLNEVRVQIERQLASQETDRLAKQWIERLKKKTFVRIF